MKILSIGNSFSQDAQDFLHQTLENVGVENRVMNLYIGGCSLEAHWRNLTNNADVYEEEVNGKPTGNKVSIAQALVADDWDVITLQQCSSDSGWLDAYEPFFGDLYAFAREKCPKAKFYIHKTWAYDEGCEVSSFPRYHLDPKEMYERLSYAYGTISEKYALPMIPSGDVVQALRYTPPFQPHKDAPLSITRDGFHMHYLYGRYAVALTWTKVLTGHAATENTYVPVSDYCEDKADEAILKLVREVVDKIVQ
ncbi:MAG: DUF4886 domain-containing protein [Clostridia bacterium]|nr:DUF4886 domain-containing protein [Clostridia bacterium]